MILDIYGKDNERKDFVNNFIYAFYEDCFCGIGRFEIKVPLTEKSIPYLVKDNYILLDEGVFGVIKTREFEQTEKAQNVLKVSGQTINEFFLRRCFEYPYNYSGKLSAMSRKMVDDLCINPTDSKRKISLISLSQDSQYIPDGSNFKTQKTGDYLADALEAVLSHESKGYKLYPIFANNNGYTLTGLEFRVYQPTDRTIGNNDDNDPIVFSYDLNNIKDFTYEENADDYKNMAYGAGAGEGEQRVLVEVGEVDSTGIDRYELYVDARDIQQEEGQTQAEYIKDLKNRALERMADHKGYISLNGTIVEGTTAYRIGTDFKLGDFVSFKLDLLDLIVDIQIVKITKSYNDNREFIDLTFGFERSSVRKILRKGGL